MLGLLSLDLISLFVLGWATGKLVGKLTRKLDYYMDYGNILGGLRLAIVKRFDRGQTFDLAVEQISQSLEDTNENPLKARAELFDSWYSEVALNNFWLMPFVCKKCLAPYINIPFSIAVGFIFSLTWWQIGLIGFISFIIADDEL